MKRLWVAAAAASLAMPTAVRAQTMESSMVSIGGRVRMMLTDTVLPSPDARPGQLTEVKGTVVEITPDTIRLQASPNDPTVAIPRILIYKVEVSLGRARAASASDAAFLGAGMSGLVIAFVPEELKLPVLATGFALGALVGALRPYEQWREAWIP